MSFVEVQPSESMRLKVRSVTCLKILSAFSDTTASVITTQSIVANAGASIPAPFAIPEKVNPSPATLAILATESVVIIACALSAKPSLFIVDEICDMPSRIFFIGRNSPIIPVEQTRTSLEDISKTLPTYSAVSWVSANPCGPVQAFAPPEFKTIALAIPCEATCLDQITGAATTLFEVKTAAQKNFGPRF